MTSDLYTRLAKEFGVERHVVKAAAFGFAYSPAARSLRDPESVEAALREHLKKLFKKGDA